MFVGTPLAYASSSLDDNYLESSIIDRFIYGEVGSTVKSIEEYLKEHSTLYIYNEIQLRAFAEYVNLGNTCENKVIKLINDIELNSNEEWIPIGRFADVNDNVAFKGTLDGQGHEIRNIKFDRESKKSSKESNIGGIIGTIVGNEENDKSSIIYGNEDEAIITNVENNGIVKAKGENAGGIAGYVTKGTLIQKVKNNGTINPDEENKDKSTEVNQVENVGGIIGLAESNDAVLTINACINNV